MKIKILITIFLIGILTESYGQESNEKVSINASINYAFLGDGDYTGFYYENSLIYSIKQSVIISAGLGFIISANNGNKNILLSHSNAYISGDLLFKIIPIKSKKFDLYFGFGNSNRYRSEIEVKNVTITNEGTTIKYSNTVSFDIGYTGQVGMGFKISHKIMILINGELHEYNKGTGVASLGLGVTIKL